MTIWSAGRETRLLDLIAVGDKTIEGRLNRGKFAQYRVGDEVHLRRDFRDENGVLHDGKPDQLRLQITAINKYADFRAMFEHEDYKQALPEAKSIDDAVNTYETYYSAKDQAAYGVLAIHVRPILSDRKTL